MNNRITSPLKNPSVHWSHVSLPLLAILFWGNAHGDNLKDIDFNNCSLPEATFAYNVNRSIPAAEVKPIEVLNAPAPGRVYWGLSLGNGCLVKTPQKVFTCGGGIEFILPSGSPQNVAADLDVTFSGTPTVAGISRFVLTVTDAGSSTECSRPYKFYWLSGGGGWGDPHITTVDGVNYDFQSAGEFTLLRGDELEIQTRQAPVATNPPPAWANPYTGITSCVSIYTAIATRVGKHRVTYQQDYSSKDPEHAGMILRVDGKRTTLGPEGLCLGSDPASAYAFSCGRIVKSAVGNGIEITYPNKTQLIVTSTWWAGQNRWYLNVAVSNTAATEGIIGLIAPDSWLPALPDGSSVGPKPEALHDRYVALNETFANAWRVKHKDTKTGQSTSLFDYKDGENTATFTRHEWPRENPTSCAIEEERAAQTSTARGATTPADATTPDVAKASCSKIEDKERKANCEFDVMATGHTGFADSYLLAEKLQPGRTETTVKADKDPTPYGESVTFNAIVAPTVSRAGVGNPAGSVQFTLVGSGKVGSPIALDATGRATWTTTDLQPDNNLVTATYIPSAGSMFLTSTSPQASHTVTATSGKWFWFLLIAVLGLIAFLVRWFRQKKP